MAVSSICKPLFSGTAVARGQLSFRQRRVTLVRTAGTNVMADVGDVSGMEYTVEIDWDKSVAGHVEMFCSCGRSEENGPCHHIWATLLAMDQGDLGPTPVRSYPQEPRLDAQHASPRSASPRTMAPHPEGWSSDGSASLWRDQLRRITTAGSKPTKKLVPEHSRKSAQEREAWFVVNIAESRSRNELVIDFRQRTRRADGKLGVFRKLSVSRSRLHELSQPEDRDLMAILLGARPTSGSPNYSYSYGWGYSDPAYSQTTVSPPLYAVLLPRLCQSKRCVSWHDASLPSMDATAIAWEGGEPWQFRLKFETDSQALVWRLSGELHRGEESRPLRDAVLILPSGLVLLPDRIAAFRAQDDLAWVSNLHTDWVIEIPRTAREELLDALFAQPKLPEMQLPPELRVETEVGTPRGVLRIEAPKHQPYATRDLFASCVFAYGDDEVSRDEARAGFFDAHSGKALLRNREREAELFQHLLDLRLKAPVYYAAQDHDFQIPRTQLPRIVQKLNALGWVIESEGIPIRKAGTIKLSVQSGVDWFELDGEIDFDGVTASLPSLLAAVRKKQSFILLDDGSQGMLPEEWLKRFGSLVNMAEGDGETLKFRPSQALLLDALLDAHAGHTQFDQGFAAFRQKLNAFQGVLPQPEPAGFQGTLREYQKEGLGWLTFLRDFHFGGCLADDMGLGKTVQLLAMLEARRGRVEGAGQLPAPSIVVVPKSLVFNWIDEASRFAPQLRIFNYTGSDRKQRWASCAGYDLLITTYGTLRNDILEIRNVRFDYAILDEATAIKNHNAQAAKASRLLNAEHRVALTGTPVENHLGELWSLFEFLNPGMLGRSTAFAAMAKRGREVNQETLALLAKAIRPFLLRRTKGQVLSELPEKTEQTIFCELSPVERKKYDELRVYYHRHLSERVEEMGFDKAKIHVLEALLRLRQAACHLGLLDKKHANETSAKLETLLEQVGEIIDEGHKALVFSQFTSLLAIVRNLFDKRGITYEYLDGQTTDRRARVKRFQEDPHCPLFLISLKAGGHGLNLTAADYVFILDPWWNPAVEAQAIDRTHRIGQTRRVFAYRVIAKDTVEDKILELQKTKRELADAIISADNSLIRQLTAQDLQMLLS